jgi:transposase
MTEERLALSELLEKAGGGNPIELFINRLKNSRRVATRYDHTAGSFLGFAQLATDQAVDQLCPRALI